MPIYEYQCKDCGKCFEALRSFSQADAPIQCEHCQGDNTQRSISVFNAVSNGSSITNNASCAGCSSSSCSSCGR